MKPILKAANFGQDADTTAAICGQVAGAYYRESAIVPCLRVLDGSVAVIVLFVLFVLFERRVKGIGAEL